MSSIDTNDNVTKLCKVTIITLGSRGDIQPFAAIGFALKKAGYDVRVFTPPSEIHKTLLNDFGLEHVSYGIDNDDNEMFREAMAKGDTMTFVKFLDDLFTNQTPAFCKPFHKNFIAEEHRPDFLLVNELSQYFGLYAKFVLKIPTIQIDLQYFVFNNPARASVGLPTLPFGMHKFIFTKLMLPQKYQNLQSFHKCLNQIILEDTKSTSSSDELSTIRMGDFLLYDQLLESAVKYSPLLPTLVCQTPLLKDILYPTLPLSPNLRFIGAAIIEKPDQIGMNAQSFGNERKEIEEFLALSPQRKPVYMGWGSMINRSTQEMATFAVKVLMMSNQRGIILGGGAGLNMEVLENAAVDNDDSGKQIIEYARENVIFVKSAPHEWLFPQVALTVHHGGAGTLHAALRAGVPTIITPVFLDQYDHSFAVQKLGVGVGFKQQLHKIIAKDLSGAILTVLSNSAMATRAKEVGEVLRKECGCRAVVEAVEKYWSEDVTTGKFCEQIKDWKCSINEINIEKTKRNTLRNRILIGLAVVFVSFVMKCYME